MTLPEANSIVARRADSQGHGGESQKKHRSKRIDGHSIWDDMPAPASMLPPPVNVTADMPEWARFEAPGQLKDAAPSDAKGDSVHAEWVAAVRAGLEPLPDDAPPAPAWLEALTDASQKKQEAGSPFVTAAQPEHAKQSRTAVTDFKHVARLEDRLARLTACPERDAQMRAADFEGLSKVANGSSQMAANDFECRETEFSKLLGGWSSDEDENRKDRWCACSTGGDAMDSIALSEASSSVDDESESLTHECATGSLALDGGTQSTKAMKDSITRSEASSSDEGLGGTVIVAGDEAGHERDHVVLSEDSCSSDGCEDLLGEDLHEDRGTTTVATVTFDPEMPGTRDGAEMMSVKQREDFTNMKFRYELQISELKRDCRAKDEIIQRQSEMIESLSADRIALEKELSLYRQKDVEGDHRTEFSGRTPGAAQ